jgi:hypothetical protein
MPSNGAVPSKRTPIRRWRAGRHAGRRSLGAVCVLGLGPAALAQELPRINPAVPTPLSIAGNADHPITIRDHAYADDNCIPGDPPAVEIEAPPRYGIVCFRRVDDVSLQYPLPGSAARHCVGEKVSGVRIIYLPRNGYTGADTFRYTAYFAQRFRFSYNVNLTIVPDVPPSPGAVRIVIGATQLRGPMPPCIVLVSWDGE